MCLVLPAELNHPIVSFHRHCPGNPQGVVPDISGSINPGSHGRKGKIVNGGFSFGLTVDCASVYKGNRAQHTVSKK